MHEQMAWVRRKKVLFCFFLLRNMVSFSLASWPPSHYGRVAPDDGRHQNALVQRLACVHAPRKQSISPMTTTLIFPGSRTKTTKEALARAYEGSSLLSLTTSSGDQVGLLFGAGLPSAGSPSLCASEAFYLLYFYGNGMCLEPSSSEFARFRKLGFNVLITEYPGYGMSSGQASEPGCYEAVAIDLASRKQVAGLIALSAFTNIPEQAHAMLPWIPRSVVRLFIKERFNNLSKIRKVTCPIFIGHGKGDELVPFVMAERLAQAARQRGPVTFFPMQGCGHNEIFEVGGNQLWTAIQDFTWLCCKSSLRVFPHGTLM
jgi:uncharacterized protein